MDGKAKLEFFAWTILLLLSIVIRLATLAS